MVKLSIIVPIYNVENYLEKCVLSLAHQDYLDYEIILVDDGSTDQSGQIVDRLVDEVRGKMEDGRGKSVQIRVIHQQNKGLSGARNTGVMEAEGEYVCFVDSDDYWEKNVLGGMMEQVEREELDVLRFTYQNVRESKVKSQKSKGEYEVFQPYKKPHYVDHCSEVVDGKRFLNERFGTQCYAVMFILKRELIVSNEHKNCLFTEGIHYEDVEWTPRMLLRASRINSTDTVVYNYLLREGSITANRDKGKQQKNTEDKFVILDTFEQITHLYGAMPWIKQMTAMTVLGILSTTAVYLPEQYKQYGERLKAKGVLPLAYEGLDKGKQRQARLVNASLGLYRWYIKLRVKG